jgi:hypothetical protein
MKGELMTHQRHDSGGYAARTGALNTTSPLHQIVDEMLGKPEIIAYLRQKDPELDRAYAVKEAVEQLKALVSLLLGDGVAGAQSGGLVQSLHEATAELQGQRQISDHLARLEQERDTLDRQMEEIVTLVAEYLQLVQKLAKQAPDTPLLQLQVQHQQMNLKLAHFGLQAFVPQVGELYNDYYHHTDSALFPGAVVATVVQPGLRWKERRMITRAQVTVKAASTDAN